VAASYFDVDGTLVRTNLIHPTLFYLMHQRTPMRSLQKLARAAFRSPQMIYAELQDRRMFNEALFTSYEGISQDRLLFLADDAFDSVLRKAIYPHARDLVSRCRDEGHDVVIVSGALDFLMKRLADHLGATHVIAKPTRDQGRLRDRSPPSSCGRRPRKGAPRPRATRGSTVTISTNASRTRTVTPTCPCSAS